MNDSRVYVNAQQVMRFVDRAEPELSNVQKARKANRSPKRFYNYRRQERMFYDTAEDLLDAFDLGYLLHTGDIDIIQKPIKQSLNNRVKELQGMNRDVRDKLREMRDSRYYYMRCARAWYDRAKELEAVLEANSLPLPPCKDSVKELAKPSVTW